MRSQFSSRTLLSLLLLGASAATAQVRSDAARVLDGVQAWNTEATLRYRDEVSRYQWLARKAEELVHEVPVLFTFDLQLATPPVVRTLAQLQAEDYLTLLPEDLVQDLNASIRRAYEEGEEDWGSRINPREEVARWIERMPPGARPRIPGWLADAVEQDSRARLGQGTGWTPTLEEDVSVLTVGFRPPPARRRNGRYREDRFDPEAWPISRLLIRTEHAARNPLPFAELVAEMEDAREKAEAAVREAEQFEPAVTIRPGLGINTFDNADTWKPIEERANSTMKAYAEALEELGRAILPETAGHLDALVHYEHEAGRLPRIAYGSEGLPPAPPDPADTPPAVPGWGGLLGMGAGDVSGYQAPAVPRDEAAPPPPPTTDADVDAFLEANVFQALPDRIGEELLRRRRHAYLHGWFAAGWQFMGEIRGHLDGLGRPATARRKIRETAAARRQGEGSID